VPPSLFTRLARYFLSTFWRESRSSSFATLQTAAPAELDGRRIFELPIGPEF